MANQVYANSMEVSCKAADGKSICAMPDVCMTPPQTPATPPGVPIPYPNTGMASDCSDGSSTVQISGQEVMLKDSSYFKKSTGDEAGSAPMKGVMTSSNTGRVYFIAWSMDVLMEGENVVRNLDMTTGNHACKNANAAVPWPHIDKASKAAKKKCSKSKRKEKKACKDYKPQKKNGKDVCAEAGLSGAFSRNKGVSTTRARGAASNPCAAARRCRMMPFNAKPEDGIHGCCPSQTGDHIIPKSSFFVTSVSAGTKMPGWEDYKIEKAPCMCLEGGSCTGSHGLRHAHHKATSSVAPGTSHSFEAELDHCAEGAAAVSQCDKECIKAQLREGHKGMGDKSKPVKYSPTGKNYVGREDELKDAINSMLPGYGGQAP